ncbi:Ig-like domain-containing protein [Roseisolibacter agri]|uniref:Ig-like domain-containing protein n=1 Tax=Roseisolibacter agri TaxID=2014610 RepID=UPI0024E16D72|nr:Ig-like domain-containing protein [Roseisolibacter agri]
MQPSRARRALLGLVTLLPIVGAACASPGVPPGGPEDRSPPKLLRISPDTGATGTRPKEVVFTFDEVVSETPRGAGVGGSGGAGTAGAGDPLEPLFIVSPRVGSVEVDWRRERIAIRPRRGFRDSTTYTITMLPGLADLRDNVRDSATVAVFSTGPARARNRIGGVVFDWVNGKPAARAIVEAIAADSTVYYTIADSVGRFTITNLPIATFLVKGVVDVNANRAADPREAFDTVRVASNLVARNDTAAAELYAFVRDTIGPRIVTVAPRDSLSLRVTFDRPLLPSQPLQLASFTLQAADSSVVPITAVNTSAAFDSLVARRARATADSAARARPDTAAQARARRDSVARVDSIARAARDTSARRRIPPPVMRQPTPTTELVLTLQAPLRPQAAYRLTARQVQSLSGRPRTSDRTFNTPKAEPARPPATPADSARPPAAATPPAGAPPVRTPPAGTPPAPRDTTRRPPTRS